MSTTGRIVGITIGGVVLAAVVCILIVFCVAVSVRTAARPPVFNSHKVSLLSPSSNNTFVLRLANIQCLPFGFESTAHKARTAAAAALFEGADVTLVQEAFTRVLGRSDILDDLVKTVPNVRGASSNTRVQPGYFTDDGLAVVVGAAWRVRPIGTHTFKPRQFPDSLAQKGVCVFEVSHDRIVPFRVANVHLQAGGGSKRQRTRIVQFREALAFALQLGAVLLGGDVNTDDMATLTAMVKQHTINGYLVPHDAHPTCCRRANGTYKRGSNRLDYVWVLDPTRVSCAYAHTRNELTRGVSDHACVECVVNYTDTATHLAPHRLD